MIERRVGPGLLGMASIAVCLMVLGGCMVGPDYRKPQADVPARWSQMPERGVDTGVEDISRWWTLFKDPVLDSLIDRAIRSNKDLKLAEARIREARAQRGTVTPGLYPSVDASGGYSRSRNSTETASGGKARGSGYDLFQAGFDASWELDIFGGVRRSVEAADATIQSAEENRRDVLVTLAAEVATNYLEVRGDQLRLAISRRNIESMRKTLELTRAKFEAGLSSELNISQQQAQLAATEATVPALESAEKQAIHQLGVLLGLRPETLLDELSTPAPIPGIPPEVSVGIPSDLLRRRPDVRRAERELAAATARIGAATADLFPKFSLTGSLGQMSMDIRDIVSPGARSWSIGPSVTWPVFDAGKIRANIEIQNARQEQTLVQYEKAVLASLKDVEDALVAYAKEQEVRRSLAQSVEATQRAFEISNELYSKGLVDFLNVLDSQRNLYASQDRLAQTDQKVSNNLAVLFKALGGGWEIPAQ